MDTKYWIVTDYPFIKTSEYLQEHREIFGEDSVESVYSDAELDKDCPPPKERETIKFLATIESDEEHHRKSYDVFSEEKNVSFANMRQCILLVLSVRKITGEILSVKGITISSTLDSDGRAMYMFRYDNGQLYVGCGLRDDRYSGSGPRQQF